MGRAETAATVSRIVGVVSAIFAIGVVAVSGTLLHQSVRYRDQYYYGGGYGGYNSPDYYYGGGNRGYYGQSYGFGGGVGAGIGYQDAGYDIYRYHRVIAIAAVALGAGIIQFLVSMLLCCVNEDNARGLAIGYVAGAIFIFIVLIACFGLAFQYRVIYPFYFYNWYQLQFQYSSYYQYNPEGQAFCAILGIDAIFLLISAIVAGVFAKKVSSFDDRVEWHVRPTTASSASPTIHKTEYRA